MTFWIKLLIKIMDTSLISELSDLSYRSIGQQRQQPTGAKEDIVNIGTLSLKQQLRLIKSRRK
jgi:hypothetical protein